MAQRIIEDEDNFTVRLEASSSGVSAASATLVDRAGGVHTYELDLDTLTAQQRTTLNAIAAGMRNRARLAGGWS